jgi:membrane-associated phospholipid phosphatase
MAAASMFFMAKVYSDYHPNSRWRYAVWTVAALSPATTALLRVRAGKHFPIDVALGYVVGAATGYLVPFAHQKLQQKRLREQPKLLEGF